MRQKLLLIVGPTASGKSALAVALAKKFNGEVISADSRQIYKGLDIGSAKITHNEMRGIRHHLLDEVRPNKTFTAHNFVTRAQAAIKKIAEHGNLPIVAGGTGFYIDALTGRVLLPNVPPNRALRSLLEKKTPAQLFALLQKRDPGRARSIDSKNKRRLIRAFEIANHQGDALLARRRLDGSREKNVQNYDSLWIGIKTPKESLKFKIRMRAAAHIRNGLIAETKKLRKRAPLRRIRQLGFEYSLALDKTQGKISKQELFDRLTAKTWQYARRQTTYWRRNSTINWYSSSQIKQIEEKVRKWFQ